MFRSPARSDTVRKRIELTHENGEVVRELFGENDISG
jgi:hypothetical protein